jgi:LPS-assembly protein
MPFSRLKFFLILVFFQSQTVLAKSAFFKNEVEPYPLRTQCFVPSVNQITSEENRITDKTIKITSQNAAIRQDQFTNFSGDVTLIDNVQKISADELAFNNLSMQIKATGNINYQNATINIFADSLNADKQNNSTEMTSASYQLFSNPGHGRAQTLTLSEGEGLMMVNSSYTTCIGETPDWQITMDELAISPDGKYAHAYGAKINVSDVPIFYVPYFAFPLTDERTSGFLYPKFGSSNRSGVEIETPFYWNIAPNMDATITPHYMSKRGTQLNTEFRYLTEQQQGIINLEYLNNDKDIKDNDDARYLARLEHIGTFSENYRLYIDYTNISDDNYLVDIGSSQYSANDAYLYQIGELSYFSDSWQTTLKLQDFAVLGNHEASYKTLPQIEVEAYQPLTFLSGQFDFYSELSSFKTSTKNTIEANRFHAEAGLSFPIQTPAWFVNSELKLMHTYYQQDNIAQGSSLDEEVSRTLPKVRIHGGINFDKPLSLFGQTYKQTLEPQLQYLYVRDINQDNIGLYDTTNLQDDYDGLFRDIRFSGLDRIAGANQVTWGLTTRLLDETNLEFFRFSLGQTISLSSETELNGPNNTTPSSSFIKEQRSAVAADLFYRLNEQWQISSDIQYNTVENYTNKSQVNLDYRFDDYHSVQLNHRYTRDVSGKSLEQVSLLANIALNAQWAFVGRITQDLQLKRSLETYTGFQYESCCWAVRIAYHRHINSSVDDPNINNPDREQFDNGFMVKFILKGLSGSQSSIGTQEMFNSSIFGYKQPYYLQN